MVQSCVAYGRTERYSKGCEVGFFRFPINENRRKLWVRAMKRENWEPSSSSRICGKHFQTVLQALWQVPSVAQFISLYRFAFKLPEIEIEELEDGLLQENEVGTKILQELLIALMKGIQPSRAVNSNNLEEILQRPIKKYWKQEKDENLPLTEGTTFTQLDIVSKVDFLHYLCCMRVDRPDALDAMKKMDADALRVQPLGNDDLGNEYWYFFGTRLYKQEPSKENKTKNWEEEWNQQKDQSFNKRGRGRPRKCKLRKSDGESDDFEDAGCDKNVRYMNIDEKSRWSVVCNTIEDWVDFAEKYKSSKSKNEKALFQTVKESFLPVLNDIYQEKERRLQQKLRELIPRRIITRRETRGSRIKSMQTKELNGYDAETAHREHVARDRANRLEERNRRLSQGADVRLQTRSRKRKYMEDDEYEEDFEENISMPSSHSSDSDDYRKGYMPVISAESSDLKTQVLKILSEVKLLKDAWPFIYRVDESYAPGYYEIVTEPMDLSTMGNKLLDNSYKTIGDIDVDFKKMVENCKLYNGENSEMSNMVMNLWKAFRKGMSKISDPNETQTRNTSSHSESIPLHMKELPRQAEASSIDFNFKQSTEYLNDKRKKRKTKSQHMEVLEIMSQKAELAVEQSQSNDMDGPQPKQYSLYSDLKILPINSHSSSLIEKFSSDSSNHEVDDLDSSNVSASSYENQSSSSPTYDLVASSENRPQSKSSTPTIHYLAQNEDSSDLSDFIVKDNVKEFNILSDGEGNNPSMLSDNEAELQPAVQSSVPNSSQPIIVRSSKAFPDASEGLSQSVPNTLEECNDGNMSNLISGVTREPLYSTEGQRTSPGNVFIGSRASISPNSTGPVRKSPQNAIPSLVNKSAVPVLHGGFNMQGFVSETTVDVSSLGISSTQSYLKKQNEINFIHNGNQGIDNLSSLHPLYAPIAKPSQSSPRGKTRYSPTFPSQSMMQSQYSQSSSNDQTQDVQRIQQYQAQKMNAEIPLPNVSTSNNVATFTTHMASKPVTTISSSQIPLSYQKMFPNPGQMMLKTSTDPNKFPTMKVTLPPSTGELLVVPGEPASSSMTFHLFAQPNSNPSQPIQSSLQVYSNGTVQPQGSQGVVNGIQNQCTTVLNKGSNNLNVQHLPKRKSPVQDLQQSMTSAVTSSTTTTVPYQMSSTENSIPNASGGLSRYPEAYTSSPVMSTFSNPSSVIRPSALKPIDSNTSVTYSSTDELSAANNIRNSNPFLQSGASYQTLCTTAMPTAAFPSYSYRFASANGNTATTTTDSFSAKPPQLKMQNVYLPNVSSQLNQNTLLQNSNGQYILMTSPKDTSKNSPTGEQNPIVPPSVPSQLNQSAQLMQNSSGQYILVTSPKGASKQSNEQSSNVPPQLNPSTVMQNSSGQYIYMSPPKDTSNKSPNREQNSIIPINVTPQLNQNTVMQNSNGQYVLMTSPKNTSRKSNWDPSSISPPQLNQNTIIQNTSGQFIYMASPKDASKKLPIGEQNSKPQILDRSVIKTSPETVAPAFYPGTNNMFALQNAPGNQPQMYTQVLPGQLPQYVNTPYYIVTDPNSFQNPQRVMNMQPVPFPNR